MSEKKEINFMIFLFNSDGGSVSVLPEKIYQGSNKANVVYFLCPTSSDNVVSVAFTLADGSSVPQTPMLYEPEMKGLADDGGNTVNAWVYSVPSVITHKAGTVTVQFFITDGETTIATAATQFIVEKGVPTVEPEPETFTALLTAFKNATAAIDGKVEKVEGQTAYNKGYVKDWAGNQNTVDVTEQNVAYSVVQRDGNGYAYISTPTGAGSAYNNAIANRYYVDNKLLSKKIYNHNIRIKGDNFDVICCYTSGLSSAMTNVENFKAVLGTINLSSANGWYLDNSAGDRRHVFGLTVENSSDGVNLKILAYGAGGDVADVTVKNSNVISFVDNISDARF